MLSNRAILTFEEMRVVLRLEDNDDKPRELVEKIIDNVSDAIEDATQQFYREKEIEEIVDGNGEYSFWTKRIPLTTLTTVSFYDGTDWQNVTGSQFNYTLNNNIDTGEIYFDQRYAIFPRGKNNIKINYVTGYEQEKIPFGIKQAAEMLVTIYYNQFQKNLVGVDSHSFADDSISYNSSGWPADVLRLLRIK